MAPMSWLLAFVALLALAAVLRAAWLVARSDDPIMDLRDAIERALEAPEGPSGRRTAR